MMRCRGYATRMTIVLLPSGIFASAAARFQVAVGCCADMAYRAVAGLNRQGDFHSKMSAKGGNLDFRRVQLGARSLESECVPE